MTLTREAHEGRHEERYRLHDCPWCDRSWAHGPGDVTMVVINRDSTYYGMEGTLVAIHESGTHMVLFSGWDISLPFGASEVGIVKPIPESELRAMAGDR